MRFFVALLALFAGAEVAAQCTANAGPASYTICGGGPQQFNGTAGGGQAPYQYSWAPAAGLSDPNIWNPVCTATATTNYVLTITDANGCTATDAVQVTVQPTADATLSSSNAQYTVFNGAPTFYRCSANATALFSFDFAGTAVAGSTHTINWGDGSPNFTATGATWATQTHTYAQGIYTATYTITQPNGCNDTQTYSVFLGTNPAGALVNPGSTTGCGPITLTFPIVGWGTNTPGTIYTINFNDGTPAIVYSHPPPASITHTFSIGSCGTTSTDGVNTYQNSFSANMLVENPCGTSGSTILPIVVSLAGTAGFTISPSDTACVNTTVNFTSTSTGNEVLGNSCDVTPALLWSIAPAAGWTVASGTVGNSNGFVGPTYDPGSWSSGSQGLGVNFNTPGVYNVTLVTGNSCGGDTIVYAVCIESPPVPAFTLSNLVGCAPMNVTSTNSTTSPNSCLTTYQWTMSGTAAACATGPASSSSSTAFQPGFLFAEPGTYTVQLRAINSCNVAPITQSVTVNAPPQLNVQALSGICAGQCVTPSATVQNCGSPITNYAWSFPGGSPATANTLAPGQVCFASSGNPTVSLTVTNACGNATANANLAIGIAPAVPTASSNSPVCAGQTISLSAMGAPGVSFIWTSPSGTVISNQAAHTINGATAANAGVYTVVAVSNGCQSAPATVNVQVTPAPTVTVTPSSAAICNGASASFTAGGAGNYEWYIGSTLVGTGPNFTTSPAVTTTYTVSGSVGACPGSTTVTVTVYQPSPVSAGGPITVCDQPVPITLTGASPAGGVWSGTNVSPGGVFTPVPDQFGVFQLTYTFVNANGCTSSAQVPVTVQDVTIFANAGNDTLFCQGAVPVQLNFSPPGGTWVGAGPGGAFTPSTVGNFVLTYNYGTGSCATSDQVNVQVVPATALTVPPDFSVCADAAIVPLAGAPVGGTWSGPGVSGPPFEFDPVVAGAGVHVLTYAFNNVTGCASVAQVIATVDPLPILNVGPDVTLCDQPIPYALGGTPAGGTWTGTWITVAPDNTITPSGTGTDVLTYTFVDGNGCSASASITVDIVPVTEPAFAGNDTSVCVGTGAVQLVGTPVGGSWTGPQVTPGGSLNTDTPGTYTLNYSVGSGTCLLIDQITVVVNALPVVDAGSNIAVCLDAGVQVLTATPAGGTWSGVGVDPATGEFDPLLAVPGGNPVTYTFTDPATGCSNSANALVTVNELPSASFVHDPIACANAGFTFTNTSLNATSFEWDFGDGNSSFATSPTHVYGLTGDVTVRLVAGTGAGCTDTTYSTVTIWDVPVAQPSLSTVNGCGPLAVDFSNSSAGEGLQYFWDFGGLGTATDAVPPAFIFPADPFNAITYPVSLTATNLCGADVVTVDVTVIPTPTAVFGPNVDLHCAYADVPFGNASYGLPDTFEWIFGDGGTSDLPGPVVNYAYAVDADTTTYYTVTLVVGNTCGTDTATHVIGIVPNEVTAFFNTDPVVGCGPLTVDLTNISAGDTALFWDLGDGNVSIAENLSHTYVDEGDYTIVLSAFGCGFDQYSTVVTVLPYPEVAFTSTPNAVCADEPFTFTNLTPNSAGVQWDFGDGNGSTLNAPTHAYATGGTYNVSLTVTSVLNGCTSTLVQPVVVNITPTAAFEPQPASGCIDLSVTFDNTSQNASFYQWDLGDGNTSGAAQPTHVYTTPGTHVVTLIAESLNGCTDTIVQPVVAFPLPISVFSLASYASCTAPVTVQTQNNSVDGISSAWDFGNGQTSSLNQPSITFEAPGTYTVALTVTNQYGCEHTSTQIFTVHPTPEAAFTVAPQPGCAGYPVTFTNGSVNAQTYAWAFGDGNISVGDAPQHIYDLPGSYTVTLIATGAGGCTDTLVVPNAALIQPTPTAAFLSDTLESVLNGVRFRNESQGAISYTWDFGDGEQSTATHPVHLFPADGGGYTVCLVAVNELGCPDTTCNWVGVGSDPVIFVPNVFTPNGDGRNETFAPVVNGYTGWKYTFLIFDRWGLEIYRTNDRNDSWNGRVSGAEPVVDVYVWRVVLDRDGDTRDFFGHVTLVR